MSAMDTKRVLVVDDDKSTRFLCTEALGMAGYKADSASDGAEALEILRGSSYGLVVSDLEMPRLDGVNFYLNALAEHQYLKDRFIFVTGNTTNESLALLARMKKKYLIKPFRVSDLLKAVDAVMSKPGAKVIPFRPLCKRKEERFNYLTECLIGEEARNSARLRGRTSDISRSGVRVRYKGELLAPFTMVDISMELDRAPLERRARVMWSKPLEGGMASAGLRFAEPIHISPVLMPA